MPQNHSSHRSEFPSKNSDIWHLYMQTYTGVTTQLDRELRAEADIKLDDFHVLWALTDNSIRISPPLIVRMGEIAFSLGISPSRLTYQIERLIKLNWVERTAVEEDRRGKGVFLTELGYQRFLEATQVHDAFMNRVLTANVSSREFKTLMTVMERILETVR